MKTLLLLLSFVSLVSFGAVKTTTNSGNFFNPFNWDCFCVPANGDSLVINHAMQMTASIYYTSGQIKINGSGSLTEDGTNRDVWVAGGSLINNGLFDCYRLYISSGTFVNTGTSVYFDSLWNQGAITNSGNITVYDILNDQTGTFENTGQFVVENNFASQGDFINNGSVDIDNNFSNCNIQSGYAILTNNNTFCVGNDFSNCNEDSIRGIGNYYIAGASSNFGVFDGSFTFNTPSGALSINTGTVSPSVSFGNGVCGLAVDEKTNQLNIYPNTANNILNVSTTNFDYTIADLSGKIVQSDSKFTGEINIETLTRGIYFIEIKESNGNFSTLKFATK